MASTFHRLSQIEDQLFPVIDNLRMNVHQRKCIEDLIATNISFIQLIEQMPIALIDYAKIEYAAKPKIQGGGGGIDDGWVVNLGVTHTISEKNSDNSYSKKIFKSKALAKRACDKQAIIMEKVIQSYIEDELTDEEWLKSLKLHGKQRESRKGCGQPKT